MLENSRKNSIRKKVQMIAANNLKVPGAGFGTQTNVVTILTKNGKRRSRFLSKEETADRSSPPSCASGPAFLPGRHMHKRRASAHTSPAGFPAERERCLIMTSLQCDVKNCANYRDKLLLPP